MGRAKERWSMLATLPPLVFEDATTASVTAAALNANSAIFFPVLEVSLDDKIIDRFVCDSKSTLLFFAKSSASSNSSFETVP
jgi:hypothetical protein